MMTILSSEACHTLNGSAAPKSLAEYLTFETPTRAAFVDITPQVESLVAGDVVQAGPCLANAMHVTASVYINDNEDGLLGD